MLLQAVSTLLVTGTNLRALPGIQRAWRLENRGAALALTLAMLASMAYHGLWHALPGNAAWWLLQVDRLAAVVAIITCGSFSVVRRRLPTVLLALAGLVVSDGLAAYLPPQGELALFTLGHCVWHWFVFDVADDI